METSKPRSFFQDLKLREVNGCRVKKRPYMVANLQEFNPVGAVAVEHRGEPSPPMAVSFCKTNKNAHILALTDEAGYVTLFSTRKKFADSSSYQENAEMSKVCEWMAYENAIFDLCWIKDDANILTASGDQSIKIWDVQEHKCIRALMGHTGSIKSISCHPTNQELIVSGSRDGSFAIWDTRCSNNTQKLCLSKLEENGGKENEECESCAVDYDDVDKTVEFDRDSFSKLLRKVPLGEARLYAKMSYLESLAYSIPQIKEVQGIADLKVKVLEGIASVEVHKRFGVLMLKAAKY